MLRLRGSVMEENKNTDIIDKRKWDADRARKYREHKRGRPISDDQQTINDKLQRKAEYNRQYCARKKALLATSSANYENTTCDLAQPSTSTGIEHPVAKQTMEDTQTINDRRQRKAEYQRQYRARKKALLATSSLNNDNMACDFAHPSTSTGIEHPVAAVSAVSSITGVTPQKKI